MTKAKLHKVIRRTHRWLGVFFGIQVLLWTVGGIYFSWTNISHIKGDDIRREEPPLALEAAEIPPAQAIQTIKAADTVQQIKSVQLVTVLDSVFYQVVFNNGQRSKARLVNAISGNLKPVLSGNESAAVAKRSLKATGEVTKIDLVTSVNGHHEYRNKPLPAYAITFNGAINSTVYVSPELGTVQSLRNGQWRVYDVLWMLHTMDYRNRSDFNNWLLRFFSVASLLSVLSGFALYIISKKKKRKPNTADNV